MVSSASDPITDENRLKTPFLLIAVFWTIVILVMAVWHYRQSYSAAVDMARTEARSSFHDDLIVSSAATIETGTYIPVTKDTPPSPFLASNPERDIVTPSGKKLTMVGPTHMMRQLHGLAETKHGAQAHITSANPLDPGNAPDEWERKALFAFEKGEREVSSLDTLRGEIHLRLMRPLMTRIVCLDCHAIQGYKEGDIRGGACISVPWQPYSEAVISQLPSDILGFGGIWVVGIVGLIVARLQLQRQLSRRKLAIDALRASEEHYRTLVEQASDGIFIADANGKYIDVNASGCIMLGNTRDEVLAKRITDLIPLEDLASSPVRMDELKQGKTIITERRLIKKDGTLLPVEISARILSDGRFQAIQRDITERKQAEEEYRTIIRTTTDGFWITDTKGRFLDINDAYCRQIGYDREEMLSMSIPDVEVAEGPEETAQHIRKVMKNGFDRFETRHRRKDGSIMEVEISATFQPGLNGRFYVFLRDVSERKQAETALRKSEGQYRLMFTNNPQPMLVFERATFAILEVNDAIIAHYGYSREEFLHMTIKDIRPPEDIPAMMERVANKTEPYHNTDVWKHRKKDGTLIDVEITRHDIRFAEKDALLVQVHDVTERKRAEEALWQSEMRYGTLFETLIEGFCVIEMVFDAHGRPIDYKFLEVNPAFETQTGLHNAKGKLMRDLAPDHEAHWFEVYGNVALTGEPVRFVNEAKALNRWYDVSAYRLGGTEDRKVGILFNDITERKQAEDAIEESEKKYRLLHESLMDGFVSVGLDGKFLECNEMYRSMLGYSKAELGQLTYVDLTPEEWHAYEADIVENQIMKRGYSDIYEKEYRRKDGTVFPVELHTVLSRDEHGNPMGMWAIARDITDRKRAEIGLKASEERFRSLITKVSNIAIQGYGPDGTVRFWNKASEDLYGYSAKEAMGKNLVDLIIPSEMRPAVADAIRTMVTTGEGNPAEELSLMRKDGSRVSVYSNHTVVDVHNREKELFCIDIDLTERKRAEEESARLHQQVESILEAAGEGIFGLNADGVHTFVNPTAAKMLGFAGEELIGQHSHRVWHSSRPDGTPYPPEECPIYETLSDGTIHHGEEAFCRKDGTSFPVDFFSAPILESGKIIGAVVTFRDITKRKHAEAELQASEVRYKKLFESNPTPMWVSDKETLRFLSVNEAAVNHYGYSREEFLSMAIHGIHPPELHRSLSETVAKNMDTIRKVGVWRHRKKDGSLIDVEITTHDLDFNGRPSRLVLANDVTERTKTENALRESEDRYRSLVEHSPDGVAIHSEGKIVFVNTAAMVLLHATSTEQVVGMPMLDLVHPDYREIVKKRSRKAMEEREPSPLIEEQLLCFDGSSVDVEIATIPFMYQNRPAVQVVARDITIRRRAEEALRAASSYNRRLIEASIDPFVTIGPDGKITDVNEATKTVTGVSRERLIGDDFSNHFTEPEKAKEGYRKVLAEGFVKDYPLTIRHTSGRTTDVLYNATVYNNEKGELQGVFAAARDISDIKKVEDALLRLKKAVDTSGEAMFLTDKDGVFTYVNPGFTTLYGYEASEIVGKVTPRILKGGHIEPHVYADFWKTLLNGHEVRGELVNMKKNGTQIDIESSASPIHDEEGTIVGYLGIQRDITKRKQAEHEFRLLAQGIASIKDCVSITDLDDHVIFVNKAFERVYGYTSADILGKDISILRPSDMPKETGDSIRPATIEGGWYGEISNRRKDGTVFPVELWTSVVKNEAGKPVAMVGVARDITERLHAERVLRASEARYRSVLTSAPDAIVTVDKDGIIVGWNKGAERIFGYRYTEAVGQPLNHLIPAHNRRDQDNVFRTRHAEQKEQAHHVIIEMEGLRKDGTEFSFELSLSEWETEEGVFYTGVIRDVSDRKKVEKSMLNLERQLFQSQKIESLGTLAGGIAHDFNNILGIILGHSSLLRRVGSDPDRLARSIQAIESATQRGASLVHQILTFARKSDVLFEHISMNDSVTDLVKLIEETFPKTVVVSMALDRDIPSIDADRTQIHQTLLNLCVNARDAMPQGGAILLSTARANGTELHARIPEVTTGDFVCVTVTDTGTGMDETTKRRIFEPFFTTKDIGKGTGLGLALVHGIVASHHGYIDVESSPGAGTSFRLYFPIPARRNEATVVNDLAEEDVRGGNEALLLVEDEEALRQLLQSLLEAKGYKVLTAPDGEKAVRLYKEHHKNIAAVVMDLGLPKMDGKEVFLQMKRIHPDVKVIIASGYFEPDQKSDLMKAGIKRLIQKPYIPNAVLEQVRSVLDLP